MHGIIKRMKYVLSEEDGMIFLEAAIVCMVVCIFTVWLLDMLSVVTDFGTARNQWTSSTGWYRSSNTEGINNNR